MSDDPKLDTLRRQIKEAKKSLKTTPSQKEVAQGSMGQFFNVGVELVSGVFVGVGAGLVVDWMFGTSPWGLILLFIFGSAAGMLNVYRTLTRNSHDKNRIHD
jgi:ATP synthase protein I